jgi:aconitate hydratase
MTVSPGSRQVYTAIARSGSLGDMLAAGARMLESACGPCVGMGHAPASGSVAVRSFNRNFEGRSGTPDAKVYLASPETCAATAIKGVITDPRTLGDYPLIQMPDRFEINDSLLLAPVDDTAQIEIIRGPNIKPLPVFDGMPEIISGELLLKMGDNITTDHISPAGVKVLSLRSNLPALAEFTFERVDKTFAARAKIAGSSIVVGGSNYGQGSAREHAALAPRYLGVQAVIALSFARIHRANLVNFGLLPLTFTVKTDYDRLVQGDQLEIQAVRQQLQSANQITVTNLTQGYNFICEVTLSAREVKILLDGGLLAHIKHTGR